MLEFLFKGSTLQQKQTHALSGRDKQALQAAYLRARHALSQEDIRRHLGGVSQSHISRLLAYATERGWLVTELHFDDSSLTPETVRELHHLLEPRRLVDNLAKLGARTRTITPEVRVFDSGSDSPTPGAFDLRCRRLGRSAAGRFSELLQQASIVGITWGRTVGAMVDGLEAAGRCPRREKTVLFVPVTAELLTLASPDYSSTLLAARLNNNLNNDAAGRLMLGGVPAFIPRRYADAKKTAIREYVQDAASYRRIFSGDDALVNRMDMVITSVGSADRPLGGALGEVLSAAEVSAEELKSLIAGDVGGVLIPKSGLLAAEASLLAEINAMWTGITMDGLSCLAQRASLSGSPGVVVVAIGKERAEIIREMISQQLINQLIIDWDLANALEAIVG